MEPFEPLINLLALLTALSVPAERITNTWKLRLEVRDGGLGRSTDADRRSREYGVSGRSLCVGVVVALVAKADLFAILDQLDAPWETLGWLQSQGTSWVRARATSGPGSLMHALAGCILTGVALGFGSKFWHDVLGTVYEARSRLRRGNELGDEAP